MAKHTRIESVYEGLLESVRRVDNFSKPEINISKLSVEDVITIIDNKLVELIQQECDLSCYDDDYKAGEVYGAMEVLEFLKENILELNPKGE